MIHQFYFWLYPPKFESGISKRSLYTCVLRSIICSSSQVETIQIHMDRRMDKENVRHTYDEILLRHKKEGNSDI